MTVLIDQLDTQVDIQPATTTGAGGTSASAQPPPSQGSSQIKAALRPIVLEILEEELEDYLRLRG